MVVGVLIVLIYLWSGESIVVLFLTITSLFAGLALWDRKPWAEPEPDAPPPKAPRRPPPVWRCDHDIAWDARGLSGVPVGEQAAQLWPWSQIDDVSRDWCSISLPTDDLAKADERVALRLDFPNPQDAEEPATAFAALGPRQDPELVVRRVREAWRDYKVTKSRLYHLSPGDRTVRLAAELGAGEIDLREPVDAPDELLDELRRQLLDRGELCRVDLVGDVEDILDEVDQLLTVKGVEPLTDDEADELLAMRGDNRIEAIVWSLDWAAEQRGYRLAFLDQLRPQAEQATGVHLVGLLPAEAAEDWDGQTVGGGTTRITLDLPQDA